MVYVIKVEGAAEVSVSYQFPRGYRYSSEAFEDKDSGKDIRILKTVKCKDNTSSDWYAERIVFAGDFSDQFEFEIFQDDLVKLLNVYFETPLAAGRLQNREKMIRIKDLSGTDRDYFSAFYRLNKAIRKEVLNSISMDKRQEMRIKNFIAEQVVDLK